MPKKAVAKKTANAAQELERKPLVDARNATINGAPLQTDWDKDDDAHPALRPELEQVAADLEAGTLTVPEGNPLARALEGEAERFAFPPDVFVAGGTGDDVRDAVQLLTRAGFQPLVGHRVAKQYPTAADRARAAMGQLMLADAVILLPGFSKSREASLEILAAQAMGIPLVDVLELVAGGSIDKCRRLEMRTGVVLAGEVVTRDRAGQAGPGTFQPKPPAEPVHDSAGEGGACTVCGVKHLNGGRITRAALESPPAPAPLPDPDVPPSPRGYTMPPATCTHDRPLSLCAICAPIADAYLATNRRPVASLEELEAFAATAWPPQPVQSETPE